MLVKETSERSKNQNLIEKKISSFEDLIQLYFEGVSTKYSLLTLLIDRALYTPNVIGESIDDIIDQIIELEVYWEEKNKIATKCDVPWYFYVYEYTHQHGLLIDMKNLKVVSKFGDFKSFGGWLSDYRDDIMFSKYQETGLPELDKILRKLGTPWPGNIDSIIIDRESKEVLCVVEYQNTTKTPVYKHENNNYMKSTTYRKGDSRRWMVVHRFSKKIDVKCLVIVWSFIEDDLSFKFVDEFIEDNLKNIAKIEWGKRWDTFYDYVSEENFTSFLECG